MSPTPCHAHPELIRALGPSFGPGEILVTEPGSDPMHEDINNILSNAAKTFENKARLYRQKAAEARRALEVDGSYAGDHWRGEVSQSEARAAVWEGRAREATAGYLLASQQEYNDPEFMSQFGPLLQQCQEASRAVYRSTLDEESVQQGIAGGPIV